MFCEVKIEAFKNSKLSQLRIFSKVLLPIKSTISRTVISSNRRPHWELLSAGPYRRPIGVGGGTKAVDGYDVSSFAADTITSGSWHLRIRTLVGIFAPVLAASTTNK